MTLVGLDAPTIISDRHFSQVQRSPTFWSGWDGCTPQSSGGAHSMPAQGCRVIRENFHGARTCFTPNLHFLHVICLLLPVLTLQTQSWPRAPVATCCLRTSALLGPPSLATGGGLGNTGVTASRGGLSSCWIPSSRDTKSCC